MTTPNRIQPLAALFALAFLAACSDAPPRGSEAASEPVPVISRTAPVGDLQAAVALGVPYAHEPRPGLLTSGQISPAQMDALARAGYTTFISLRLPTEEGAGWEEAYTGRNGLTFARIPVDGPAGLTRENAEALDRILDAVGDAKTALYCGSANRVGALLAMRAHWLDAATPEEAVAVGRAAGMTRLEPDVAKLLGLAAP